MINAFRFVTAPPLVQEYVPNSFEFLTIGDPGNAADTTTYGAVDYDFEISKYAVRIADISAYNAEHAIATDDYAYELDQTVTGISEQSGLNASSAETYLRISNNGEWMVAGDTTDKTVRLYNRDSGTGFSWSQFASDIVTTELDDTGISVDVNDAGTIVFSSPLYDDSGAFSDEGRVQVYERVSTLLTQRGPDFIGAVGDELGTNVAIANSPFTGDIMIAFCSENGNYVKVYEYSSFTWTQVGSTISISSPGRLRFNNTGSRLIVGSNINTTGKVQVYEWSGSAWGQIGSDINGSDSTARVGRSVDITSDGNTIAIGGYHDGTTTTSDEGFVKVYEWSGSSWDEKGNAEINGAGANNFYGEGIALDDTGTQVVVGNLTNSLLVYQWNGSAWNNSHTITGSSGFGRVAASNSTGEIIITNNHSSGDVYTYINDRRILPEQTGAPNDPVADDQPAQYLTWNYAARFVNWLNTRHGYEPAYKFETFGVNDNISLLSAGDNGYDPDNRFRHSRSVYYIPTEDEWYKAAFYDPNKSGGAGYYLYGVGQDTAPTAVASGTLSGTVVYDNAGTTTALVISAGGLSPYGTMGQTGNTYEWNESASDGTNDTVAESRAYRGGTYTSGDTFIRSTYRSSATPDDILTSSASRGLRIAKRNVIIVDDADTAFTATAGFTEFTGNTVISGYNVNFYSAPSGTGSEVATWTFQGLEPGNYNVAISWDGSTAARATNAPFTVFDGTTAISTEYVYMSSTEPEADYIEYTEDGGAPFEIVFPTINITSDTLKVELTDNADDYVIADAVRIKHDPSWSLIGSEIVGGTNEGAGWRVDLNDEGNILAVAVQENTTGALSAGEVKVYENISGTWTQIGSGMPGAAEGDSTQGVDVKLNSSGDTVVVGWPAGGTVGGSSRGEVRVYENSGGTWSQLHTTLSGEGNNDRFGRAIDINGAGDTIAVGAWLRDSPSASDTGAVYIYENTGSAWSQVGSTIYGETSGVEATYAEEADYWGWSVAINDAGDKFVGSAYGNDAENYPLSSAVGHVRVYELSAGDWVQVGDDINGDVVGDSFGYDVSMNASGSIIAASSYRSDGSPIESDYVRVYENVGGTWTQIGDDIVSDVVGRMFGYNIQLNAAGDMIAIGEFWYNSDDADRAGRALLYKNVNGSWTQVGTDIIGTSLDDRVGRDVGLNARGNIIAVGATLPIGNGDNGSTRVYKST